MKKKEIPMPTRIAIALIGLGIVAVMWSVTGVFDAWQGAEQDDAQARAQSQTQEQPSNKEASTKANEENSAGKERGASGDKDASANANTIIDNDLVTVDYEGMYEAPGVQDTFYVGLNVQNKRSKDIWVYLDKASVNNETVSMVMTGMPLYIEPGNSGRTGFIFPMGQLSVHSLSGVEKVKFDFVVADKATLTEIWRGKDIEISQGS